MIISKKNTSDSVFDIVNITLLLLITVTYVYPLLYFVLASVSDPAMLTAGNSILFIPKKISFEAYKNVFANDDIWRGYRNTIFYTVTGTLFNLFLTFTAAYPLACKNFKFKKVIMPFYTVTMFFNGGMIPTYFVVQGLGMVNTASAMILLGGVSVMNLIIVRTYIQNNIPEELWEAATISGCNELHFFCRIVLPLCGPIIAVMVLFYAVGHWNNYFEALIYLSNRNLYPLQIVLRDILINNDMQKMSNITSGDVQSIDQAIVVDSQMIKYCVIIVSTVPVLAVYPFVQKYFVQGIMVGSIKG